MSMRIEVAEIGAADAIRDLAVEPTSMAKSRATSRSRKPSEPTAHSKTDGASCSTAAARRGECRPHFVPYRPFDGNALLPRQGSLAHASDEAIVSEEPG